MAELNERGLEAATRTFDSGLYAQFDDAYKRTAAATAVRAYVAGAGIEDLLLTVLDGADMSDVLRERVERALGRHA